MMDIIFDSQYVGDLPPLPRDAPVVADILKAIEQDVSAIISQPPDVEVVLDAKPIKISATTEFHPVALKMVFPAVAPHQSLGLTHD